MMMRTTRRLAFTLVEFLTVLAIVGLLAAILVPLVGRVRQSAREAQSCSNMRQVAQGVLLYASDHDGRFPLSTHGGPVSQSWLTTVRPYLGENDAVRVCPLDARAPAVLAAGLTSFTLNEWMLPAQLGLGRVDPRFSRLNLISDASRAFLLFVARDDRAPSANQDHTHGTLWSSWSRVLADIDPDRFRRSDKRGPDRTGGSAPYAFADGHVEVIPALRLKERFDAGVNVSRPGLW